ncbi:hypothetical protein SPF06_16345 [Sinomonas sp. JGH33]|uniref:Uncharacterized protein n=1 Tax=Sinomonas terricola TaxID=3110330 RepID=A0ABU5T9P5_9MICC|nr:hypothetical protein [Sinomonas sp. JGH33]MEA5456308.1 hypothetical protein [Sinomonas sp. JGH33]
MARRPQHPLALLVTAFAAVALAASVPESASAEGRGPSDESRASSSLDVASSAIPTSANPLVTDAARSETGLRPTGGKAVATAVATSECNGCSGTATTLQTVTLDGPAAAVGDNVATAWSSCVGCSSTAVSVQIITGPRAAPIEANNRSLAANIACADCQSTAVALQFVILGGTRRELSAQAKAIIQQIEQELGLTLAAQEARNDGSHHDDAERAAEDAAARARDAIKNDTRADSVAARVDVETGD